MNIFLKILAAAAAIALLALSCQEFSPLKDEDEGSKTAGQTDEVDSDDNDDMLDAPDIAGSACNEGDRKTVSCNSCVCKGNSWFCSTKGCSDSDDADDVYTDTADENGNDAEDCDALGVTWRFADGRCFMEEWAGCGPKGVSYSHQKECLEKNALTKDLQWLPIGDSCKGFYAGSMELIQETECAAVSVTEGQTCTGNGGPGCSGDDCKTQEKTSCKAGDKILSCRPVDFECAKG